MATLTKTDHRQLSQIKQPSRIEIEVTENDLYTTTVKHSFDGDGGKDGKDG